MFSGEPFDYDGAHHRLRRAIGRPVPAQARVPIHIGGGGPKLTMPLVEALADWWNCPGYALDRIDELRPLAGSARISTQHPIGLAPDAASRDEVIATVHRRFGSWGGVIAGTADEVAGALAAEVARGVEGFVLQFSDFGTPETAQRFMAERRALGTTRNGLTWILRWPPSRSRSRVTAATRSRRTSRTPTTAGPHPGVVVIHHMPGYDRSTKEIVRTFAAYGYAAVCPNLHHRYAPGAKATDAAAAAIEAGGVPDDQCVGDVRGAVEFLRSPRGHERTRRRDRLLLGRSPGLRRRVQRRRRRRSRLLRRSRRRHARGPHARAVPSRRSTAPPNCGARSSASSASRTRTRRRSRRPRSKQRSAANDKTYEFHTFENAGHAFFSVDRPNYRVDAAREGWKLIWDFFGRYLGQSAG